MFTYNDVCSYAWMTDIRALYIECMCVQVQKDMHIQCLLQKLIICTLHNIRPNELW